MSELNYSELGVDAPSVDIHQERIPINVGSIWKQKGNYIYREGDEVKMATMIPTGYILTGTDDKGLPQLVKIKTQ